MPDAVGVKPVPEGAHLGLKGTSGGMPRCGIKAAGRRTIGGPSRGLPMT